jgi:hypothetical protein
MEQRHCGAAVVVVYSSELHVGAVAGHDPLSSYTVPSSGMVCGARREQGGTTFMTSLSCMPSQPAAGGPEAG